MSDNQKYYYLKLVDNFFDRDEMIMLDDAVQILTHKQALVLPVVPCIHKRFLYSVCRGDEHSPTAAGAVREFCCAVFKLIKQCVPVHAHLCHHPAHIIRREKLSMPVRTQFQLHVHFPEEILFRFFLERQNNKPEQRAHVVYLVLLIFPGGSVIKILPPFPVPAVNAVGYAARRHSDEVRPYLPELMFPGHGLDKL